MDKLIEAGWEQVRRSAIAPNTPQDQIDDTRLVYFSGALHLFTVFNSMRGEDDEAKTQAIAFELANFSNELDARARKS